MPPFGSPVIGGQKPSPEGNICAPIMHFQCKNNFEHLLKLQFRNEQKMNINEIINEKIYDFVNDALMLIYVPIRNG